MEKARYCYDCIHKDVCRFAEDAAKMEAVMKKKGSETPVKVSCKFKLEDRM